MGEEGLASFWPNNPWYKPYVEDIPAIYYPLIQINGLGNGNFTFGKSSYWYQHPRHYSFSGKMSQAHGAHYFKVGAEYRHHIGDGTYPNLMNFIFAPTMTANSYIRADTANSGDPWASFLLGAMESSSNANKIPFQSILIPFFGAFVQVGDGIEGLVHISEMSTHHVDAAEQVVTPGEELWVKIIDLDLQRRRISLSIKQAAEGGIVAAEYQEHFGEHAYDDEGNYIGGATGDTPSDAEAAWAEYYAEHPEEAAAGGAEGAAPATESDVAADAEPASDSTEEVAEAAEPEADTEA